MMRFATLAAALLVLSGCGEEHPAKTPPPIITTVEVAVPVAVKCIPETLGADPDFPDTDAALLSAEDAAARYLLLIAGRPIRIARIAELNAAITGCRK